MIEFKPKTKTINLMLLDGGAGDHVASLVAVSYILNKYTWVVPYIWIPDFLVSLATNLLPVGAKIRGLSQLRGEYNPSKPTKTTKWDGIISPMKIHVVDYAFLKLTDENPTVDHKNYLQLQLDRVENAKYFELPEKYIVFTTGFTADVREWPALEVNKTVKYCVDNGYTPVFLGQGTTKTGTHHMIKGTFKEEIDFKIGINLIDKTSLLDAAIIMHHSHAVLGVDNGLLHVAGCTKAPIIGGFTTVRPEIRMPIRNNTVGYNFYSVVPNDLLDCKFCQQETNFLYGHDYRNCLYKEKPRKNLCTEQMTADKFIHHLERLLN